jgi:hypothetical protein
MTEWTDSALEGAFIGFPHFPSQQVMPSALKTL